MGVCLWSAVGKRLSYTGTYDHRNAAHPSADNTDAVPSHSRMGENTSAIKRCYSLSDHTGDYSIADANVGGYHASADDPECDS